jgi:hypothetical protein
MFNVKLFSKANIALILVLMTFSTLTLAACGTSNSTATDAETEESEGMGSHQSTTIQHLDPENLYDPPEGIQTITLPQKKENGNVPRDTYMRFAMGKGTATREKGDVLISTSTTGFFFLGMAERAQGGVQDMGVLSDSIDTIEPPESGYILGSKVDALEGHTYAIQGRDDEPGHFIIVRVTGFGEQPSSTPGEMSPTITIDYLYK